MDEVNTQWIFGSIKGSLRIQRNLNFHTYPQIQKVFALQYKAINAILNFNDKHLKYHHLFILDTLNIRANHYYYIILYWFIFDGSPFDDLKLDN